MQAFTPPCCFISFDKKVQVRLLAFSIDSFAALLYKMPRIFVLRRGAAFHDS